MGAVERGRQRQKMQRQKNRQRDAGQPMQDSRDEAALSVRGSHALNTANTARKPRASRSSENNANMVSSERPRQGVHSRKTLRKPIGAWIATAITNAP